MLLRGVQQVIVVRVEQVLNLGAVIGAQRKRQARNVGLRGRSVLVVELVSVGGRELCKQLIRRPCTAGEDSVGARGAESDTATRVGGIWINDFDDRSKERSPHRDRGVVVFGFGQDWIADEVVLLGDEGTPFVVIGARDHGDPVESAGGEGLLGRLSQESAVDEGVQGARLDINQLGVRNRTQAGGGLIGASNAVGDRRARRDKTAVGGLGHGQRYDWIQKTVKDHVRAAFGNRFLEKPRGGRRGELAIHTMAARRLAEDRNVAGIAAEGHDILVHPTHRELLIL